MCSKPIHAEIEYSGRFPRPGPGNGDVSLDAFEAREAVGLADGFRFLLFVPVGIPDLQRPATKSAQHSTTTLA